MHGTLHIDVASWTIRLRVGPKLGEQLEPKWLRIIVSSISVRINIISVFNIISTINFSISIITGFRAMLRLTAASTTTVVRIMAIAQRMQVAFPTVATVRG